MLKHSVRLLSSLALVLTLQLVARPASAQKLSAGTRATQATPATPVYVVTNDDVEFPYGNDISVYQAAGTDEAPSLTYVNTIWTGGYGSTGGFFSAARITSIPDVNARCIYVSNSGDNSISTISLDSQEVVEVVQASDSDDGTPDGIGMAANANYLYASYTASKTIAVFTTNAGCGLTYLQSVPAAGLNGGAPAGMAVNANALVVAYADGSFESFNISSGIPVSNNDRQNSTAYGLLSASGSNPPNLPSGVDITSDGRTVILGDISTFAYVEVTKFQNGKLQRTIPFRVNLNVDAGNIRLSPDQKLIYIVNNEWGTVTAASFDPNTGAVSGGCTSPTLRGFNERPWFGGIAMRDTTGSGNVLYVAEYGRQPEPEISNKSAIGILTVTVNGNSCTLTESPNSPQILDAPGMLSIGVYPPRPF